MSRAREELYCPYCDSEDCRCGGLGVASDVLGVTYADDWAAPSAEMTEPSSNGATAPSDSSVGNIDPPEDGAGLLDDVRAALTSYVVFPSEAAADAVTLYAAATHAQHAWEHATRLVIKSPLKRCGKTRLQEILVELCHATIPTANISAAALVRSIDEDNPPTLVIDEGDTVFAKRRGERSEGAEDLRGIINAGHSRGWPYLRWDAKARTTETCSTFAMAIIGGIGDFPDTIEDRAVIVRMRRRAPGEAVAPFRRRRAVPGLQALRARLHAWGTANVEALKDVGPELPVEDRAADVWEPLVAIADRAGGNWPQRARAACAVLTGETEPDDGTLSERLLADLRDVFGDSDKLTTTEILERLNSLHEAPWGDYYGHELRPRDLARLLKPYGVKSKVIRIGATTPRGYEAADFEDTWTRYLDNPTPDVRGSGTPAQQAQQVQQGTKTPAQPRCGNVADSDLSIRNMPEQPKRRDVADVADVAAKRLGVQTTTGGHPLEACIYCNRSTARRDTDDRPVHENCLHAKPVSKLTQNEAAAVGTAPGLVDS